jgi:pimeloyl-ACP methyl ester carboxylesterase
VRIRAALLLIALEAASCGGPGNEASDPAGAETVRFETSDGVTLEGKLFGEGNTGVVLSHMFPSDQSSWFEFAGILSERDYVALTYDFRGYCPGGDAGCSAGEQDFPELWRDVSAAMDFLRSRRVTTLFLVGASMGGTASLVAASTEVTGVGGVVTLSAPREFQGLAADDGVVQGVFAPKLFVAGIDDFAAADAAQAMYSVAGPPKRVEIITTADHGTDLLYGSQAEVVRRLVLDFLSRNAQP